MDKNNKSSSVGLGIVFGVAIGAALGVIYTITSQWELHSVLLWVLL